MSSRSRFKQYGLDTWGFGRGGKPEDTRVHPRVFHALLSAAFFGAGMSCVCFCPGRLSGGHNTLLRDQERFSLARVFPMAYPNEVRLTQA